MDLPILWGYLIFFLVPIALWFIGALAIRRRPFIVRLLSVVAGSDNRLSLSRLQAFAWTLVIFGSFAAAMAVHTRIRTGTAVEARQKSEMAKRDLDEADVDLKNADTDLTKVTKDLAAAKTAFAAADEKARESRIALEGASDVKRAEAEKNKADDAKSADSLKANIDRLEQSYGSKLLARNQAQEKRNSAEIAFNSTSTETDWVHIPTTLLALAGIALGSGVFSSLIAALNSEAKIACVTALKVVSPNDLKTKFPDANAQASQKPMIIEGADFGGSGRARTGNLVLPVLYWSKDGKAIAVDISKVRAMNDLVIETPNGKLAYTVTGGADSPVLGLPQFVYDLADLFRDDKNPSTFSLMKFQMFGWTVVAICIYTWIFLTNLTPHISALPPVDQSIVLLTGLSQGGYLAGKAVSNAGKTDQDSSTSASK